MKKCDGLAAEEAEARAKACGGEETPVPGGNAVERPGAESRHDDDGGCDSRNHPRRAPSVEGACPLEHDAAVTAINYELRKQDKGNLRIGEIVDRAIGPAGRADYGEQVIAGLAADPDLMCSGEHLRRCLHYYRLMRGHGGPLRSEYPELQFGHLYQISRLLQLEGEFDADVAADATRAMAIKAMDEGKGGKPMPVDALAKKVTTHIKSLRGRGSYGKGDHNGRAGAKKSPPNEPKTIEDDHAVLNEDLGAILVAAERISDSGRYDHACDMQTNVDLIARAHFAILGHIARHDPQSIVIPAARKRIIALAGLVGLTVVEADAPKQGEVSP